jgi:hypothetical protein
MEGHPFKVDVYSACEKVELFLNGKSLGVKPTTKKDKYLATFEVPYATGELKAVGYARNQPVAECEVKTAGAAQRIRLTPDRQTIRAETGDLCFITVEITDQDGLVHPPADHTIYFTVKGEERCSRWWQHRSATRATVATTAALTAGAAWSSSNRMDRQARSTCAPRLTGLMVLKSPSALHEMNSSRNGYNLIQPIV